MILGNPNSDIRVIAALASADFVLSPIQLNQEAMDGVSGLLNHERVGLRKIRAVLNSKLVLIGLLPTLVEPTPFQKANFLQVIQQYHPLMIRIGDGPGDFASLPCRLCIAVARAEGAVLRVWAAGPVPAEESRAARPLRITPGRGIEAPAGPHHQNMPEAPARTDQRVRVEFKGHDYQLVVSVVPDQPGCIYVRPLTGGPRRLAPVAALKLLGFVGG
jgi:hypothetical protein